MLAIRFLMCTTKTIGTSIIEASEEDIRALPTGIYYIAIHVVWQGKYIALEDILRHLQDHAVLA